MSWRARIPSRPRCCGSTVMSRLSRKDFIGTWRNPRRPILTSLVPKFPEFLSEIEDERARAHRAVRRASGRREHWIDSRELLASIGVASTAAASGALLAWLFLQPYAEHLAERANRTPHTRRRRRLPVLLAKAGGRSPAAGRRRREAIAHLLHVRNRVAVSGGSYAPACGEETRRKAGGLYGGSIPRMFASRRAIRAAVTSRPSI